MRTLLIIQNIENSSKKNESLKQKKDFFKEYQKKEWNKSNSILLHLNEIGFITQTGFYVQDMILTSNKLNITLKPFTKNS